MFTTTSSIFAAGFSQKKFLKQIEADANKENEEVKETLINPENEFGEVNAEAHAEVNEGYEEEKESAEPKLISKKIVVKAHK